MSRWLRVACCAPLFFLSGIALPHHSLSEWDPNVIVELEGEVVDIVWRNPHVRFSMMVINADGEEEIWGVAGQSLAHLDRRKVPRDAVEVGDIVRVSGSPSNRRGGADQGSMGSARQLGARLRGARGHLIGG